MPEGSEGAHKRDKYVSELNAWLDCGNRRWLDESRQIDIENGGSAVDVVMGAVKSLMGKIQKLEAA